MEFKDPKVEFVEINTEVATIASECSPNVPYWIETAAGSVETCNGTQAPMNNCSKYVRDGFVNG